MVYSLGYAACRFYETKLKSPQEVKEKTINDLQKQSQQYLETAIAQQVVMDRILAPQLPLKLKIPHNLAPILVKITG
jgi:hypothetical protein